MKTREEKYLNSGANECPNCGSTEISNGTFQSDSNIAWCEVTCKNEGCGVSWDDQYKLIGIDNAEGFDPQEKLKS